MAFAPIITELYALRFKERPDYKKMVYMFKKILLDMNFLPTTVFDWSLKDGQDYPRINSNSRHSSISSCSISSLESEEKHHIVSDKYS